MLYDIVPSPDGMSM